MIQELHWGFMTKHCYHVENQTGRFHATPTERAACEERQRVLPIENRLDQFRKFQFNMYLPGQHDWSSSLQQLVSLGGALFMPSDLRTQSLWSWVLATRCPECTIAFNRSGSVCSRLVAAYDTNAARARQIAERLEAFVQSELNDHCMRKYARAVINGIRWLHPKRGLSHARNLTRIGFSRFTCQAQHELVAMIAADKTLHDPRHASAEFVPRHFGAWFDQGTCRRRDTPLPLPWAPCEVEEHGRGEAAIKIAESGGEALAWC